MEPHDDIQSVKPNTTWAVVREWAQVIVIALLISLPIRFFVAEPFIVNGASMDPTFSTGQFLIVDRLTYRFESPSRGDVIVFEYPGNPSIYYIKRIIGLPGETLNIKDGVVTVTTPSDNKDPTPGQPTPNIYVEPATHVLKEPYIDPSHASHDSETVTLGPTQYFVMGDNRLQSSDSRSWGPLDQKFIIGRPIFRLFPLQNFSLLPGAYKE